LKVIVFPLRCFFLSIILSPKRTGKRRFELVTFASWGVVPYRLSYPLETIVFPCRDFHLKWLGVFLAWLAPFSTIACSSSLVVKGASILYQFRCPVDHGKSDFLCESCWIVLLLYTWSLMVFLHLTTLICTILSFVASCCNCTSSSGLGMFSDSEPKICFSFLNCNQFQQWQLCTF